MTVATAATLSSFRSRPATFGVVAAALVGVAVGILTSVGQGYLPLTLNPLVNSASAWLVAPFVIGVIMPTWRTAAFTGLVACLTQLVGYYVTANVRGFPAGDGIVLFWTVCGLVGGPVFGAAGHLWRAGPTWLRGLGGVTLPSAFFAEGLWIYLVELHSPPRTALWLAIGIALTWRLTRAVSDLRWFAVALPLGLLGEIVVAAALSHP